MIRPLLVPNFSDKFVWESIKLLQAQWQDRHRSGLVEFWKAPAQEFLWQRTIIDCSEAQCSSTLLYITVKDLGYICKVCGCYVVLFSCSPTSTDHIYTKKTCIALTNLQWNICKNWTSSNLVMIIRIAWCWFLNWIHRSFQLCSHIE